MADDSPGATTAVRVSHRTAYRFDPPVRLSTHELRFRPAGRAPFPTWDHELVVDPPGGSLTWQATPDGEWVGHLEVRGRVAALVLESAFSTRFGAVDPLRHLDDGADTRGVAEASAAARRVQAALTHVVDHGEAVATPAEILARGTASCRDSALVLAHQLREAGFATRIVTGYLVRLAGEDDLVAGPWPAVVPASQDLVAYHAWAEVLLPGPDPTSTGQSGQDPTGGVWIGFDATTGRPTGGGHVPVASGGHPRDTVPVSGSTEPATVRLTTSHSLRRC